MRVFNGGRSLRGLSVWIDRRRFFVDGLLESLQRLADAFAQRGQAAGAEEDQDDHQNDDQFRHAQSAEHGVMLSVAGEGSQGKGRCTVGVKSEG